MTLTAVSTPEISNPLTFGPASIVRVADPGENEAALKITSEDEFGIFPAAGSPPGKSKLSPETIDQ